MTLTICPSCAAALSEFIRNGTKVEQHFQPHVLHNANSPTLTSAIQQVLQAKQQSGRRKRTIGALRIYLNQFARGREQTPIAAIDADTLEAWFLIRNEPPRSKRSSIGRLSSLFSYGVKRGWIENNPCKKLEMPIIDRNMPKILTMAECDKVLQWAINDKPNMLAWVALTLLVGLRPESEADKVTWQNIDLENNRLIIYGEGSKVRQFRVIDLTMTPALPWLRLAKERGAKLGLSTKMRSRYTRLLRPLLGWWANDVLRHSAASYLNDFHKDEGKTATMLGTSIDMLHEHYLGLVAPNTGKVFMAMLPPTTISSC